MAQPEIQDFETNPELSVENTDFRVTDDSSAEWAMRKLAKIRHQQEANRAIYASELLRIKEWLESVNAGLDNNASFFEGLLSPYALKQREDEGRKSIVLPHGTVKTTKGQNKLEVDQIPFIEWATNNAPDLIRIKVEVAVDEIKKLIKDDLTVVTPDGEVVPSVKVIEGVPSVSFSPKA